MWPVVVMPVWVVTVRPMVVWIVAVRVMAVMMVWVMSVRNMPVWSPVVVWTMVAVWTMRMTPASPPSSSPFHSSSRIDCSSRVDCCCKLIVHLWIDFVDEAAGFQGCIVIKRGAMLHGCIDTITHAVTQLVRVEGGQQLATSILKSFIVDHFWLVLLIPMEH